MINKDRWWCAGCATIVMLIAGCTTTTLSDLHHPGVGDAAVSISTYGAKADHDDTPLEFGTGILYRNDAVITAAHVVDGDPDRITVNIGNQKLTAQIAGVDLVSDIALLRLNEPVPVKAIRSAIAKPGDDVYAFGNGDNEGVHITRGLLTYHGWSSVNHSIPIIKGDLNVWGGFSGGPIVDRSGRLVGIITARTAGPEGIAIGVQSDIVMPVAEGLYADGEFLWRSSGLSVIEETAGLSNNELTKKEGLRVANVESGPNLPLWAEQFQIPDNICDEVEGGIYLTHVAGYAVKTAADARRLIDTHHVDDTIDLEFEFDPGVTSKYTWPLSVQSDTPYLTRWSCNTDESLIKNEAKE